MPQHPHTFPPSPGPSSWAAESFRPLDVLFLSEPALWPLDVGFRVHGFHLATGLSRLGLRVGMTSLAALPDDAGASLRHMFLPWPEADDADAGLLASGWRGPLSWPRHRVARFLAPEPRRLAGLLPLVRRHRPRVVVGLSLHTPIALRALADLSRRGDLPPLAAVWYAADELVRFHLSCLRGESPLTWPRRLSRLGKHWLLERLFAPGLEGVVGVSPADTRLLRWVAGARRAITVRNGVDLDGFAADPLVPGQETHSAAPANPQSLVFWGRLDFEPNIDAVRWFASHVWPELHRRHPQATWRIVGKAPAASLAAVGNLPGVVLVGPVPDIRREALAAAVAILPMRLGGGIKNKLLEAAAMARPIVASPRAVDGLDFDRASPPWIACGSVSQWIAAIEQLWSDPGRATDLGREARTWVQQHHTWQAASETFWAWAGALPGAVRTAMPVAHPPLRWAA